MHTRNLEEDAANAEIEKEFRYTLHIAQSKRHECPKLKITVGGEEVSALLTQDVKCQFQMSSCTINYASLD